MSTNKNVCATHDDDGHEIGFHLWNDNKEVVLACGSDEDGNRYLHFNTARINTIRPSSLKEYFRFRKPILPKSITVNDIHIITALELYTRLADFQKSVVQHMGQDNTVYHDAMRSFILGNNMAFSVNGMGQIMAKYTTYKK